MRNASASAHLITLDECDTRKLCYVCALWACLPQGFAVILASCVHVDHYPCTYLRRQTAGVSVQLIFMEATTAWF